MYVLLLLFFAFGLAVIVTIVLASFNLVYLLWYISAFFILFSGMFWLREELVDRRKDREDGTRTRLSWWHKNSPVRSGIQLIGLLCVFLYLGIMQLGTDKPFMYVDYLVALFGGISLFGVLFVALWVLGTMRERMKHGDETTRRRGPL